MHSLSKQRLTIALRQRHSHKYGSGLLWISL
jgi:hypothetical protein